MIWGIILVGLCREREGEREREPYGKYYFCYEERGQVKVSERET